VAKVAATGGAVALLGGALVARHKLSGSTLSVRKSNPLTGKSAKGAGYVRPMVVTDEFGLTVAKKTVIASPALRGKRFVATYQHKKLTKGSVYGRNVEKIRAPKKGKKRGKPAVSDPFSHVSSKGKSDPNWSPVKPGDEGATPADHRYNNPHYDYLGGGRYGPYKSWARSKSSATNPLVRRILGETGRVDFS